MFEIVALLLLSQQPIEPYAVGKASYYTVESSSHVTASGERLDNSDLTCAMNTGEFGQEFLVVADNGNSVVVRLNDRGPHINNRVIDLSKAAMRKLSAVGQGIVHVRVYAIGKTPPGSIP